MVSVSAAQRRRRHVFAAAALTQLVIFGTAYAFPLWLVAYKRIFEATQMQANIIGIAIYLSVSCIGIPLSPIILPVLSPTYVTATVAVLNTASYGVLYAVAVGACGHHGAAFAVLIAAIIVMLASAGIFYSLAFGTMMRPDFYGPPEILLANGMIMTAFALGGVVSGCLFYFTGLGLKGNMLIILVAQGALTPAIVLGVWATTTKGRGLSAGADEADESEPLLGKKASAAVNADGGGDDDDQAAPPGGAGGGHGSGDGDDNVQEPEEPAACGAWVCATLRSWRYYHTILIILLKVGIGGTFTTNIGSAVAAALPASATEAEVDSNISLVVICVNFAQLVGRLMYTLSSAGSANPNVVTVATVMLVAVVYGATFAARILAPFTFDNLLISTCVFGVFYGVMWCTTGGLLPFVPYSRNVPRVLAMTQSFGGIGNVALNTLAGYLYDQQAKGGHNCYGKECYRESDLVMICVSGALFVVAGLRLALGVPGADGRWPRDQAC